MAFDDGDARDENLRSANPNGAPSGDEFDAPKKKPLSFLSRMLEDAQHASDEGMGNREHLE
jgi:hypothetical protein